MEKILLLHGALGSTLQLKPLTDLLKDRFEIFDFNFSGHGGKSFNKNGISITNLSTSLADFICEKNLNNCNVFGYSLGGYIAFNLQLNRQVNFNKIITLATKFEWNIETSNIEISKLNPEKIELKIPEFAKQLATIHYPNDWKQLVNEVALMIKDLGTNHINESQWKEIECPVRICIGDRDQMVRIEESLRVYRSIINGSFSVFPETYHPIEKINYNRLAMEIKQFML